MKCLGVVGITDLSKILFLLTLEHLYLDGFVANIKRGVDRCMHRGKGEDT